MSRTPMDRAANGLEACGKALTGLYNAAAQGLPMAAGAGSRALGALDRLADAAERAVTLAERAADVYLDAIEPAPKCGRCEDDGVVPRYHGDGSVAGWEPCPAKCMVER